MLCGTQKKKRDEWLQRLKKIDFILGKIKASAYETNVAREIENDIEKYFNNEEKCWTIQQVLGIREVLRGTVGKHWVSMPLEIIDVTQHNNDLIKRAIGLNCE